MSVGAVFGIAWVQVFSLQSTKLYRCVECSLAHFHSISHMNFTVIFTHEWDLGSGGRPKVMAYAVDVGHFTHFAFTVNFTHYVKTKPDSGFTVKSRTLLAAGPV